MKNTSSGDAEGSSSNPQQPDQSSSGNTSSPLRRPTMAPPVMGHPGHSAFRPYRPQGRQQSDQSSPQRGSGSNISSPMQRPPVAPPPPVMGHPGQSAFRAHRPQGPQPQRQFPGGGGSSGGAAGASVNVSGSGLFGGAQAIPVGGSGGGGGYAAGGVEIGNPIIRKRVREGNQGGQAEGGNPFQCRVCGKPFQSAKALFGHMRQHPDRGWKGAFPPPSFRAEEEFADVPGHLNPGRAAAAGVHVEHIQADAAAQAGEEAMEVHEERQEAGDGAAGPQNYKLPDLNYKPPQDDDDAAA